jgi:hypothetical protein
MAHILRSRPATRSALNNVACRSAVGFLIDNWWVQGRSDPQRELLDTAALVGHLVPAGSVYPVLAEHRERLFPYGMFADLFQSGRGRRSVPGDVIASVFVLQAL